MSKPTTVPTWATDTNYDASGKPWNGTPTKVDPVTALKEQGYAPADKPTAQTMNHQLNLIGQWIKFFDDVITDSDIVDEWNVQELDVAGDIDCAGNANIDGDLTVVGDVKHGNRSLSISPYTAVSQSSITISTPNGGSNAVISTTAAQTLAIPIPLRTGDRLKSVTFARAGNGTTDITDASVWVTPASPGAGATNLGGGQVVTNPSSTWGATTVTPTSPYTFVDGNHVVLALVVSGGSLFVGGITVVYDRP